MHSKTAACFLGYANTGIMFLTGAFARKHGQKKQKKEEKKHLPGKRSGLGEPALSVFHHVT